MPRPPLLPAQPLTVETPCGPYEGVALPDGPALCAVSILRAKKIPSVNGDTRWTNLAVAFETLPERLKQKVEGLRGVRGLFAARGRLARARRVSASIVRHCSFASTASSATREGTATCSDAAGAPPPGADC